ncbi:PfkB family carbohydrate kinase [Paucibacter sp. APW11]|uniref:PfkB family carbohydrate kinase n=1 Tax=Roseateles aquae TaxID=3077235 RepID=A0ABU3P6I3_9BURK|nr:PfkB family carbohydrate kinase [Paucibacter sp. APW11]MDT8998174.1 PfkB family carbohydrate kinase [Paucibacter sp. APW11]
MNTAAMPFALPGQPVLLLGEALVDEFADQHIAGGAPLNVARSLAALGQPALLATRLGEDAAAALILQSLRRFGLSEAGVQRDAGQATGRVTISESANGGHSFHIHEDAAWDHLDTQPLAEHFAERPPAIVYFGSLAQRSPAARQRLGALLDELGQRGSLRYLDLNLRAGSAAPALAEHCLARADWVKLNDVELVQLMAWFDLPGDPALVGGGDASACSAAVRTLAQRFALQRIVLTRGAAGYACFDRHGLVEAEGGGVPLARLVDTVGAGDAFSAMALAATLQGKPIAKALALANRFAAAMCGERGPVPADEAFYLPWHAALGRGKAAAADATRSAA